MNAPGRPMIRTFLPAQALRTSKKTGGLNSRPSCAWLRSLDGVCLLSLSHVSAGRVRTTVSRFSALRCVTVAFGSCRSPRATAPRELCGDCYVGGTLLPAWTFTSGIASPAFTMAASERERFAAGGSVFAAARGLWVALKHAF